MDFLADQLYGRRVVGHFHFGARTGDNAISAQRYLSLRNPTASVQTHAHILRMYAQVEVFVPGVAATYAWFAWRPVTGFTVTDSSGGSTLADTDFTRLLDTGAASVMVGRHAGSVSGGTLGTTLSPMGFAGVAQGAADTALSDEPQHQGTCEWIARSRPLLLTGNTGIIWGGVGGGSGGGTINLLYEIEWLESVPVG